MNKLERLNMMRRLRGLMLLMLMGTAAHAQNISSAEYFLDTDPGIGNGTPITIGNIADSVSFSGVINTYGLTPGDHFAYVRTQTNGGAWSLHTPQRFYIKALLTDAEYFWDADPGVGNGTPINVSNSFDSVNVNATVSTTGLSTGYHTLYVRIRTEGNQWSLHAQQRVHIRETVAAAEYFWDTDPGVGNGTAIALTPALDSVAFSGAVSTTGLLPGRHTLFVRTQSGSGAWSMHQQDDVMITNSVIAAEYFWDTDPGVGNTTALNVSASADSISFTDAVTVPMGPAGIHYLYVRTKAADGVWGLHTRDSVYVQGCIYATAAITGDTVFCNGNSASITFSGTPDAVVIYNRLGNATNDTVMLDGSGHASITTGTLTSSATYILIAAYDADFPTCQTGLEDTATVTVVPCGACTSVPSRPSNIQPLVPKACPDNTITFSVPVVTNAAYYQWTAPANSVIVSGQGSNTVSVHFENNFSAADSIRVVAVNGCGQSIARTRLVQLGTPPSLPSSIVGNRDGVCELANVAYSVTPVTGAIYNWSFDAPGATVTSGQGTASVIAAFSGFHNGNIMVTATNGCGTSSTRTAPIKAAPARPMAIYGSPMPCPGDQNVAYSTDVIPSATLYKWVAPTHATISDGVVTSPSNILFTTSASVTVNFGNVVNIMRVYAINDCDTSTLRTLMLTPSCPVRLAGEGMSGEGVDIDVYPNPAHDALNIGFDAATDGNYSLRIVDAVGESVWTGNGFATKGSNVVNLNMNGVAAGVYNILLTVDGVQHTRNFIVK